MSTPTITRKALRISTIEGSWAALHFLITTGVFFTGFALMLGANDFQLGLLGAIPVIAQVFQILGAYLIERTGLRKGIVAWFSVVSRTMWLPMALIPFFVHSRAVLLFMILYAISSVVMNIAAPGWVTWMAAIIPASIRGRYFGARNRINGFVSISGNLAAGFAIDLFRTHGHEAGGYLTLQLIAVFAGIMAFTLIRRQPDPGAPAEPLPAIAKYLLQPLRDPNYRRILAFYLYWVFAVGLASPFFNAHLLKHMQWNFKSIAVLGVIASLTMMVVQTYWGRLIDRYGHRPVLMITVFGILHLPFYYAFCPWGIRWPIYVNALLTGVFWAGFGLASFNLVIDMLPSRNRTMYVAVLAALSGITSFAANVLSGSLAEAMDGVRWQIGSLTIVNYQILFVMTGLLRIPALLFLRRIREPDAVTMRVLVAKMFAEFNQRVGLSLPMFSGAMKDSGAELPKQD
jgi:MFS family permease